MSDLPYGTSKPRPALWEGTSTADFILTTELKQNAAHLHVSSLPPWEGSRNCKLLHGIAPSEPHGHRALCQKMQREVFMAGPPLARDGNAVEMGFVLCVLPLLPVE